MREGATAPRRRGPAPKRSGLENMPKRGRNYGGSSFQRNGADSHRGGRNNGWLDFEHHPMGVGESRLAYRCRVEDGCYRGYTKCSYCIVKIFKNEGRYSGMDVSQLDVDMQVDARNLAATFNRECQPTKHGNSCNVHIRDAALGYFEEDHTFYDDDGDRIRMDAHEDFLLERQIRGSFEKFNSNSGWSSGDDPILDAFSHWTWVHTDGEKLVCDLQGHREDNNGLPHAGERYYYLLTDPATCTPCHDYGESDLGQSGIDAFFAHHTCNEWCERLDIEYERPSFRHAAIPRRQSTSYHSLLRY